MSKTLRSHFGEPNVTTLFNELGNAKQIPTETAQEFAVRMISLRQKVLLVSNEDKCGYSTSLIHKRFLHAILVGFRNGKVFSKPLLKNTIVSDEDILGSLDFATADELEHISKFKNKELSVHTIEASEDISKPHNKTKTKNQLSLTCTH